MKTILALTHVLLISSTLTLTAQPAMRGPLPDEQQEIIADMAKQHADFKREVKLNDKGYTATTTTTDKALAAKLKAHLKYMAARLDSKAMVRRWDPAFVELVEYYDQLDTKITELDDGVKVEVIGKNADAVKVAQNHARIVTGFTKEGAKAVEREHKPALTKEAAENGSKKEAVPCPEPAKPEAKK